MSLLGALMGMNRVAGSLNVASAAAQAMPVSDNKFHLYVNAGNSLQALQGLPVMPKPALVIASIRHAKLQAQVAALVAQLPMSIAACIDTCEYFDREEDEDHRFVITYVANRRRLVFYDVDAFPSAEHISRIALSCP